MQKAKHLLLVLVLAANIIVASGFIWLRANNGLAWHPLVAASGGILGDRTGLVSTRSHLQSQVRSSQQPIAQDGGTGLADAFGRRTWGTEGLGGYLRDPAAAKPAAAPHRSPLMSR